MNPSEVTLKKGSEVNSGPFLNSESDFVATIVATSELIMPRSDSNLPYREARMYHRNDGGKKRYYIEFYAWDAVAQRLKRKRVTRDLNRVSYIERKIKAAQIIKAINTRLQEGYHFDSRISNADQETDLTAQKPIHKMRIPMAIDHAVGIKRDIRSVKPSTLKTYLVYASDFKEWIEEKGYSDLSIKKLNTTICRQYLDHLKIEKKVANKTYNHYMETLRGLVKELIKREPGMFKFNPFYEFEKLPTKSYKHAAYSDNQMKKIKAYFDKIQEKQYVWLYITYMYYSLIRPNELRLLKIGDIHIEHNRILIQGENSKEDEDFCGIPRVLMKIIKQEKIMMNPDDFYVFGKGGKPGPEHWGKDHMYGQNKRAISDLRLYEVNPRFDMYSYKHTGAISLYKATKDIKLLQAQMRHTTVSQTETYLRDLGMSINFSGLDNWEGAI